MIKAVAIDDEPLALSLIRSFCEDIEFIELVATFSSTAKATEYLQDHSVDLLFLDIQMPGMNGIEFSKTIPGQTMTIFTTAFSEYAVEGFNLNALDYLLKPFEFSRFLQAATKAKEYFDFQRNPGQKPSFIYIKDGPDIIKLDFKNIVYLQGVGNYIKVHRENEKPVLIRMNMKDMNDKLAEHGFIRVHRSYIVSMSKAVFLRGKTINMGSTEIPVGKNFLGEIRTMFNEG